YRRVITSESELASRASASTTLSNRGLSSSVCWSPPRRPYMPSRWFSVGDAGRGGGGRASLTRGGGATIARAASTGSTRVAASAPAPGGEILALAAAGAEVAVCPLTTEGAAP